MVHAVLAKATENQTAGPFVGKGCLDRSFVRDRASDSAEEKQPSRPPMYVDGQSLAENRAPAEDIRNLSKDGCHSAKLIHQCASDAREREPQVLRSQSSSLEFMKL